MLSLDKYLGHRLEFADGSAPDVTVVSYDERAKTVRLHIVGGARQTMALPLFTKAVEEGALLESHRAPFVHPPETRFDRFRATRLERMKHRDSVGISTRGGIRTHADMLKGRKR